jgi:1-aminocyclopropane-1-carboxylate deaminase
MGFVNLLLEVAEQENSLGVYFDTIIVCSVTGSSHAGTLAGAVLEGKGRRVIGIDASGKPEATKDQVARIARGTVSRLDPEAKVPDEAIVLDERFHAGIYGIPDDETIAAMKRE